VLLDDLPRDGGAEAGALHHRLLPRGEALGGEDLGEALDHDHGAGRSLALAAQGGGGDGEDTPPLRQLARDLRLVPLPPPVAHRGHRLDEARRLRPES
jgi:hypothetical protein